MPEIPDARTGWQRRVVSAVANLIAGKDDDFVRARIQAGGKFLSPDMVDQILGEAYSSMNAANRISTIMHSGTGYEDRRIFELLGNPKEAVVDIDIGERGEAPKYRTVRIPLNSGATLGDLHDAIREIIDQWNEKYGSSVSDDSFRIRYILGGPIV